VRAVSLFDLKKVSERFLYQSFAKTLLGFSRQTRRTKETPLKGGVTLAHSIPASENPATRTHSQILITKRLSSRLGSSSRSSVFPFRDKTADVTVAVRQSASAVQLLWNAGPSQTPIVH